MKYSTILATMLLTASVALGQYRVETINPPSGANLEVGGMDFAADGTLMMCTRTGDVWAYHPEKKTWKKFARGLQEALGLLAGEKPGEIFVLQRSELTRLVDEDQDGRADLYERYGSGWDFNGSYHEYAFGLVRDSKGNFYGNLGLAFHRKSPFNSKWLGTDKARYRGWHFRITPEGRFEPLAPGLRAPNGICIDKEDNVFTTDNQGSYIASSVLMHATKGDFLGHPDGLLWDPRVKDNLKELIADKSRQKLNKMRKRPAVYIPFPQLGRSISSPMFNHTGGKFGPYDGQIFVGDVIADLLMRIQLEKVGGEFQGSVVAHIKGEGLSKGVNRLAFDKQGTLWVGLTNRGWAKGQKGLQKITFGGKADQTIHSISLAKGGFTVHFTQPISSAASDNFEVERWIYKYTNNYNAGTKDHEKNLQIESVKVAPDKKSVFIGVDLKTDHVYGIKVKNLGLKHDTAYYTLNRLR